MTSMAYFLANNNAFFIPYFTFLEKCVHLAAFTKTSHKAVVKDLTPMLIMHQAQDPFSILKGDVRERLHKPCD